MALVMPTLGTQRIDSISHATQATLTGGPNGFINFLPQTIRFNFGGSMGRARHILPTQTLNMYGISTYI